MRRWVTSKRGGRAVHRNMKLTTVFGMRVSINGISITRIVMVKNVCLVQIVKRIVCHVECVYPPFSHT
jgi:hypothetical protein